MRRRSVSVTAPTRTKFFLDCGYRLLLDGCRSPILDLIVPLRLDDVNTANQNVAHVAFQGRRLIHAPTIVCCQCRLRRAQPCYNNVVRPLDDQRGVSGMRRRLLVGGTIAMSGLAARAEEAVTLKDAPGRDIVEGYCGACRSLDYPRLNAGFLNRKGWESEVDKNDQGLSGRRSAPPMQRPSSTI